MKNQKTLLTLVSLILFTKMALAQCTSFFPLVVTGPVNASALPGSILTGSTINGKSFNLNGTLTVNIPILTINTSTIEMGANAKIIINPNCSLIISNNSWLRSCSSTGPMWEGIEINPPPNNTDRITLVVNGNSKIEDAVHAIYSLRTNNVPNNGYFNLDITDAIFNRNYRSIHLDNPNGVLSPGAGILSSLKIIGGQFYCRLLWSNSASSGNHLHSPYAGQRTYAQIEFKRAALLNPIGSIGLIGHSNTIDNGVYGIKLFNEILIVDNLTSSNTDWHIFDEYEGSIEIKNSQFTNARIAAIEVKDFSSLVNIHHNTFLNDNRGVYVHDNLLGVIIYNNTFTNITTQAIFATNCISLSIAFPKIYEVYNNTINATGTTSDGIYWSETNTLPAGSTFKIRNNPSITGVRKAIELLNVKNLAQITDNPIININANAGFGIKITGSTNALIKSNIVSGVVASACTSNTSGIINENSLGAQVKCNLAQNVTKGFVFKGVTTASTFLQNTMGKAQNQFYLENNAGGLGNVGNASSPSLNVWQVAACDGFRNTNGFNSNLTGQGFTKFFYYNAGNGQNPSVNFMNPGNVCIKQGTSFLPANGYCTTGGGGTTATKLEPIVDGSTTWEIEDKASELMAKEYVYEEVKNDPTLLQSQILSDAIAEIENSTLGELLEVTDTMPNDSIAVDSLLLQNQNIAVNYLPEENFKIINEFILISEDDGFTVYDAMQLQTITDIANQCPLVGGNAVYIARAILANITGEVADYENDCLNYGGGNNRLASNQTQTIFIEEKIITRVDYYDLQGRFITSQKINSTKKSEIKNGIYLVKSFFNDELISIEKFVSF